MCISILYAFIKEFSFYLFIYYLLFIYLFINLTIIIYFLFLLSHCTRRPALPRASIPEHLALRDALPLPSRGLGDGSSG